MNERAIFEAALEIQDSGERRAYLDKACADRQDLRRQVETLLESHAAAGSFLDIPVVAHRPEESDRTLDFAPRAGEQRGNDSEGDDPISLSFLRTSTKPSSLGALAHYEVLQVLGQGGFGIVMKAFDEKLHRLVAIKVLNPEMAATSPPRKRFLREARASAAIRHENVVQVYSVDEQPLPYLVMEYIDGQTLQQKMDEVGPLEVSEVLHIGRQIANGLAAAHAMGIIHRDIKPANILLEQGAEQKVKITDFGLARAVDDASMTRTGNVCGTPMYMAPEQAQGQNLDHRADLFSFGSVLYQMACGRPPFRAPTTVAVLRRVSDDTPRPLQEILPEIPDWLVAIVAKLHAKQPHDRFQSAKEVADLLARYQSDVAESFHDSSPSQEPAKVDRSLRDRNRSSHGVTRLRLRTAIVATVIGIAILASMLVNDFGRVTKPNNSETRIAKPLASTSPPSSNTESQTPNSDLGWYGWPADAPPAAIAPFDAAQAQQHQAAWANYLGVPIERTNSLGMKFRLIPPGEFLMGSTEDDVAQVLRELGLDGGSYNGIEPDFFTSQAPLHRTTLTQPFYLGLTEVTQEQYQTVIGESSAYYSAEGAGNAAVAGIPTKDFPVEWVSWIEATRFCDRLSMRERLEAVYFANVGIEHLPSRGGYRLPTEAQWEFACRAGTQTEFWTGNGTALLRHAAWFGRNEGKRPHAVGELKSNPFGLFDMHGNVWEWCHDRWDPRYYEQFRHQPAVDPLGPSTGASRIFRGGCWYDFHQDVYAANRHAATPLERGRVTGFRLVLPVVFHAAGDVRPASAPDLTQPPPATTVAATEAATDFVACHGLTGQQFDAWLKNDADGFRLHWLDARVFGVTTWFSGIAVKTVDHPLFELRHRMPDDDFAVINQDWVEMRDRGFRPVWDWRYLDCGHIHRTRLWIKDDQGYILYHGPSEEIVTQADRVINEGYTVSAITPCQIPGESRYIITTDSDRRSMTFSLGLSREDMSEFTKQIESKGWSLDQLTAYESEANERFVVIASKNDHKPARTVEWDLRDEKLTERVLAQQQVGLMPWCITAYGTAADPRFAVIWCPFQHEEEANR
jgi:serine/threonine protein kinase